VSEIQSFQKIRQQYLSAKVEFRGAVAYRKIFPESQVSHIRGLPNDTSVWRGNGGFMFLSRLGKPIQQLELVFGDVNQENMKGWACMALWP
jgi:hypothetical protein